MNEKKEGDRQSNGRHIMREAYAAKREEQMWVLVERQIVRASRTLCDQLDLLDQRLGKGVGAKKERARSWMKLLAPAVGHGIGAEELIDERSHQLKDAKMESRGYRIMRRLGLSERESLNWCYYDKKEKCTQGGGLMVY